MLCGRICEVLRRGLVVAALCAGCLLPARAWADVVPSLGSQVDDQDVAVGSIEVETGARHDLIDPVSVEMNANERRASMPKNYFPFSFNGTLYQSRAYEMLALSEQARASLRSNGMRTSRAPPSRVLPRHRLCSATRAPTAVIASRHSPAVCTLRARTSQWGLAQSRTRSTSGRTHRGTMPT